ncbi:ABC transporter ATP-binding protein [Mycolicibacterium arenosum]|uniref:ABC transporter ATP-binding protein n=1 Tax=Mycolicibacterium arenosum TaxID=2952157 RepID=A0ABT1MDT4_9MYCO|nr:ABC transporter ATP-binding protein [Mycolicibacterium sp. CAU 1645]MCP9276557.1 ABC transporter ATP-binding protein [Mycolicibacterium sp. CAU 1645]
MRTIEVTDIHKSFGNVTALAGAELRIDPGEHLALLGPSGSGKSTMLRVIAGLEPPDRGDVRFDGCSQLGIEPHRRDVALVFQQYALYPHLTAMENITLGLRRGMRMKRTAAEERARDVASRLEIDMLLDRLPKAMSGGQRQRVSLARALARHSGIVLLDEPMSGLDAQLRLSLRVEIGRHLRAAEATVLHVTHDQSDAMVSADRVAVINHGVVQQVGTARELYTRPATRFVGRFFGTPPMNTFAITLAEGACISAFGQHTPSALNGDATLGVRPEHFVLGGSRTWRLTGEVASVELAGSQNVVHVLVDGQVIATQTSQPAPSIGEQVELSCYPADVHLFAGPSEARAGSGADVPLVDRPVAAVGSR